MDIDALPPVLTLDETAALLRFSRFSVRQMVRDGRLDAVFAGRAIRIPRRSVLELLGENGGGDRHDEEKVNAAPGEERRPDQQPTTTKGS